MSCGVSTPAPVFSVTIAVTCLSSKSLLEKLPRLPTAATLTYLLFASAWSTRMCWPLAVWTWRTLGRMRGKRSFQRWAFWRSSEEDGKGMVCWTTTAILTVEDGGWSSQIERRERSHTYRCQYLPSLHVHFRYSISHAQECYGTTRTQRREGKSRRKARAKDCPIGKAARHECGLLPKDRHFVLCLNHPATKTLHPPTESQLMGSCRLPTMIATTIFGCDPDQDGIDVGVKEVRTKGLRRGT